MAANGYYWQQNYWPKTWEYWPRFYRSILEFLIGLLRGRVNVRPNS